MKAIPTAVSDARLHHVEAQVAMQIRTIFGRWPALAGFAVQDLAAVRDVVGLPHDSDRSGGIRRLFITDMGFSATVSREDLEEIYALIGAAISDAMSEQPEAFELLRGRTFARTLH